MKKGDTVEPLYGLRKEIRKIRSDLDNLGGTIPEMPELIDSANLLRTNEHLSKMDQKKTELLSAYARYSEALEKMLSTTFEIQNDLKEILQKQSSMIHTKRKKRLTPRHSKK